MSCNAQLIEHIATYAAERGDDAAHVLEDMCDSALAGDTDEDIVLGILVAARGPDVTDYDDLPTYVDREPWASRTEAVSRTRTVKIPYRSLSDEATAWVAEYRAAREA